MKKYCVCLLLLIFGCKPNHIPRDLHEILAKTSNSNEFYEAIEYFKHDSLKTEALFFVIRNMPGKRTIKYTMRGKNGEIVEHDWSKYNSFYEASESARQEGIFVNKDFSFADIDSLNSDFIIQNIENAFKVWNRPWSKDISFRDFCEYVLPYKDSYEMISSNWRGDIESKYSWINQLSHLTNLKLAQRLNDSLKRIFNFNYNYVLAPPFPDLNQLYKLGKGPCPYMTSLAIYTMRGMGIPTARDFVPYWTNIHHFSSHAWNSMLSQDGKWYGFMGCESNPGLYAPKFHAAKVFRETFSIQNVELHNKIKKPEDIPEYFRRNDFIDVTSQYYDTDDISMELVDSLRNEEALYLAVYNTKQWRVVHWGIVENGKVTFKNMAKGVVYLPMSYSSEKGFNTCMNPILFDSLGKVISIVSNKGIKENVNVRYFGLGELGSKDFANPIEIGKKYTLYYWAFNHWNKIGSKTATISILKFADVPEGALLSLGRNEESEDSGEQLFIFRKDINTQVFW